jgi:glycosyltransferase involved in cell wall biosynthesis
MLGIGIITFKRKERLENTLNQVIAMTTPPYELMVADDGSPDDTIQMLKDRNIDHVTGLNHGISWNKNRALFYLKAVRGCENIILLEDDTFPVLAGWERSWLRACTSWGHVNFASPWPWFRDTFVSGSGSVEDPFVSPLCSGQCTAFSREALEYVGYLDTRFRGYGYEHGEHSQRFLRMGFGGHAFPDHGGVQYRYKMLSGGLQVLDDHTFSTPAQVEQNEEIFHQIQNEGIYRAPWRTDQEMYELRSEMLDAYTAVRGRDANRLSPAS